MHSTDAKFWSAVKRYRALPPERAETQAEKEARGLVFRPAMEVHITRACLHFVGFRGDEFTRAVRVFGVPDFIHRYWDHRAIGDIVADLDTVVFAKGSECDTPNVYAFNDSECF